MARIGRSKASAWAGALILSVLGVASWAVAAGATASESGGPVAAASEDTPEERERKKEYALKAAYLYNFATFVEWPEERFEEDDSPIVLGILGDDPFGEILDKALEDRRVGDRAFEIKRFESIDEAEGLEECHILFLCTSERKRVEKALKPCRGKGVLVVSEMGGVIGRGGVVNFFIEKKRVKFEIQVDEAEREGLTISSKLLRLARIVRDEEEAR